MAIILGTDLDENLFGTNEDDLIKGEGGHDVLRGYDGSDTLEGGSGDDRLGGDSGADYLAGDEGADELWGGGDDDSLNGGGGDDQLSGGAGADTLMGGDGDDTLNGSLHGDNLDGGAGADALLGGQGADTLVGGADADTLNGGSGNDEMDGGAGADTLIGGSGHDEMDGGAGDDRVRGGAGNDTGFYRLSENADATDSYDGGIGFDILSLNLTAEEAASAEVQADIQRFVDFLTANADVGSNDGPIFRFHAFDLKVRDWEVLEIKVPSIDIEKSTNGEDADTPTGPVLAVGDTATFTYAVTNTGNIPLNDVVVTDDNGTPDDLSDDFNPTRDDGVDTNNDGILDPGESWTYSASTTVTEGQYANIGEASGTDATGTTVSDEDPSHHFGGSVTEPGIVIEKSTNGEDADTATGPVLVVGDTATFTYVVTNTGTVPLGDVTVTDDQGVTVSFDGGDDNGNNLLDVDETWTYSASTTVTEGQYSNIGKATGIDASGTTVMDEDPSHHLGRLVGEPGIDIEKSTNGEDADAPTGPVLSAGDTATFTYVVTNTGTVPLNDVVVTDDNGTPGDPSDDFSPTFDSGDDNNDGLLDPDETWTYSASTMVTAGQYKNIGRATGTDATGTTVGDEDPSHHIGEDVPQNGIIWQNGGQSINIGDVGAVAGRFSVGTDNPPPSGGEEWNNAAGDRQWSDDDNWDDQSPCTSGDGAVFDSQGAGLNVVDSDCSIAWLHYTGEAGYTTDLNGGSELNVDGNVSIGVDNVTNEGRLTILDTKVTVVSQELNVGWNASDTAGAQVYGTLVLGPGSELDLTAKRVSDGDTIEGLFVGWNSNGNSDSHAEGVLDATAGSLTMDVDQLVVGGGEGFGTSNGTLRWDSDSETIDARDVTFGWGSGATGELYVPSGGTMKLGEETDRVENLWVGYNNRGAPGTAEASIDLAELNPDFTAWIDDGVYIGHNSIGSGGSASGELILGGNSELHVGDSSAVFSVGWNRSDNGHAQGTFDASDGTVELDNLSWVTVGWSDGGTADGTFTMGDDTDAIDQTDDIVVRAEKLFVGNTGEATATFNLRDGLLEVDRIQMGDDAGGQHTFNFTGGTLSVRTFNNGDLSQQGGTLAPGTSAGKTTVHGDYDLASAGTLEIEILGPTAGIGYDQVDVNGDIDLNADGGAGGTLDVVLDDAEFCPSDGDTFLIIDNDGVDAISDTFQGLGEGATFNEVCGEDIVTFQISYAGGDGNDVALTVTDVASVAAAAFDVSGELDTDQDALWL